MVRDLLTILCETVTFLPLPLGFDFSTLIPIATAWFIYCFFSSISYGSYGWRDQFIKSFPIKWCTFFYMMDVTIFRLTREFSVKKALIYIWRWLYEIYVLLQQLDNIKRKCCGVWNITVEVLIVYNISLGRFWICISNQRVYGKVLELHFFCKRKKRGDIACDFAIEHKCQVK